MTNSYKGKIDAPVLGAGVYLQFTWEELAQLEAKYGGDNWWQKVIMGLDRGSPEITATVVGIGAKRNNESFPITLVPPIMPIAALALDALCWAVRGKSADEVAKEIGEQMKEALDPLTSPVMGGNPSSKGRATGRSKRG